MKLKNELLEIADALIEYAGYLREGGAEGFDWDSCVKDRLMHLDSPILPHDLARLDKIVQNCTRCSLCQGRKNAVFGEGNPDARIIFIGEAPGEAEDLSGKPFQGEEGELFTKIIKAMGFSREEVYVTYAVKCRPRGISSPKTREVKACLGYLQTEIRTIAPDIICAMGKTPAQALLDTHATIFELRGRFCETCGIPLMPTFSPAYLLRNPKKKRETWEDVQKIMKMIQKKDH